MKKIIFTLSAISILMLATCAYQPISANSVNSEIIEYNKNILKTNEKFIDSLTLFNSKIIKDSETQKLFASIANIPTLKSKIKSAIETDDDLEKIEKLATEYCEKLLELDEYKSLIIVLTEKYEEDLENMFESSPKNDDNQKAAEEVRDEILSHCKVINSNKDLYVPGLGKLTNIDGEIWDTLEKILPILIYFVFFAVMKLIAKAYERMFISVFAAITVMIFNFLAYTFDIELFGAFAFIAFGIGMFFSIIAWIPLLLSIPMVALQVLLTRVLWWINENTPSSNIDRNNSHLDKINIRFNFIKEKFFNLFFSYRINRYKTIIQ